MYYSCAGVNTAGLNPNTNHLTSQIYFFQTRKVVCGGLCTSTNEPLTLTLSSPGGEPDIPAGPFWALKWPRRAGGALFTGARSAESRSVCLWRTALAWGLIGRPRYTADSVHTPTRRQQTQTLAYSVPAAQL